jgi:hypothetical protein
LGDGCDCRESLNGSQAASCMNTIAVGSLIDTTQPGEHTFTVIAVSHDGQRTARTVDYTVAPSNQFVI